MKKAITLGAVAVCLALTVTAGFSQQPPNPAQIPPKQQNAQEQKADISREVPAEMQSAKEKLESARADLAKAGDEWGGYRGDAMKSIDEAIANINKCMEYRAKNMKK